MLPLAEGDSTGSVGRAAAWVGVRVGVGVSGAGVAGGVAVAGAGVGVWVAGGVTCKTNFCSGLMIEDSFSPFQAIRSFRLTS